MRLNGHVLYLRSLGDGGDFRYGLSLTVGRRIVRAIMFAVIALAAVNCTTKVYIAAPTAVETPTFIA